MSLRAEPISGGQDAFGRLCQELAPLVTEAGALGLDPFALLVMLGGVESSFGLHCHQPRFEKAYARGGKYFNADLDRQFGDWQAMSYGPWQVMFVNARSVAEVTPIEMLVPRCAGVVSAKFLDGQLRRDKPRTPEAVLDMWNTGNSRDSIKPDPNYITKGVGYYRMAMEWGAN